MKHEEKVIKGIIQKLNPNAPEWLKESILRDCLEIYNRCMNKGEAK